MTGEGLVDLYTAMQPVLDKIIDERASQREGLPNWASPPAEQDGTEGPQNMKIAIIGQPNVVRPCRYFSVQAQWNWAAHGGSKMSCATTPLTYCRQAACDTRVACCDQGKSTLCNKLLGRERSLTGPEPGLTRDAVAEDFEWEGHSIELVDSAGWVKAAKLPEDGCR